MMDTKLPRAFSTRPLIRLKWVDHTVKPSELMTCHFRLVESSARGTYTREKEEEEREGEREREERCLREEALVGYHGPLVPWAGQAWAVGPPYSHTAAHHDQTSHQPPCTYEITKIGKNKKVDAPWVQCDGLFDR